MPTRRLMMGLAASAAAFSGGLAAAAERDAGPLRLAERVRTRIAARMARERVPALAVCAVRDGEVVAIDALGEASLPFRVPADTQTLFHIGSVSKHITAAAIMRLVADGRIGLDDPIGRHARDLPPALAGFTIRALLSHTSGVPDYGLLAGLPNTGFDRPTRREDLVRHVAELQPGFLPGEAWSYSNTGYVLLGYVIADVTGRSYPAFVTGELLAPARMREARVDDAPAIIMGRAEPYVVDGENLRHAVRMDGDFSGWADGGILMSARDAARWEVGLQAAKTVNAAAQLEMTTPTMLSTGRSCAYGLGWNTDKVAGRAVHYHGGSMPGFLAYYLRAPEQGVGVVALTNLGAAVGDILLRRTVQEVAEQFAPGSTPLSLQPIADSQPELTAEARAMLMRGRQALEPTRFAPEIASLFGKPAFGRAAPPNRASRGALARFELVEAFGEGPGLVRRYRAQFGEDVEHYAFAYTADGKIYRVRGY